MGYEVIARKWRPQRFADVVGQDHVTRTLANALQGGRLAHAYLFVGPRGTGKTTTARILAKALNCQNLQGTEPCNECVSCREIIKGNSLDVIEIDGASNRGIDRIQELRENVRYAPVRGPFKVYIIDEVHMLTREAFNAILKTLEEPPPHVKFFFATTEPQKVLTTILSRCQRFDLRPITVGDIIGQLKKISAAEGIQISDDALLAVARGAEGGLRDAESALDQLVSFRGKKIEEADVLSVFGLISRAQLNELAAAVLEGRIPRIVEAVAAIDSGGKDLQRVVFELLEHFRNLLIFLHAGDRPEAFDLPEAQMETLKKQAAGSTDAKLLRIIELLIDADSRMRCALSKRTLLETALIRAARAAVTVTLDDVIRQIAAFGGAVDAAVPAADPAEEGGTVKKKTDGDDLNRLLSSWPALVERIVKAFPHAQSGLSSAVPTAVTESQVELCLDPEFSTERAALEQTRTHSVIRKTVSSFLKRTVSVYIRVDAGNREQTAAKEDPPADKEKYIHHPAVRSVLEAFSGEITEVRG